MAQLQEKYPYYLNNEAVYANEDLEVTDKYSGEVATRCALADAKAIGKEAPQVGRAQELSDLLRQLTSQRDALATLQQTIADEAGDEAEQAARYSSELLPAMEQLRASADALEELCADGYWSLPTYQEMLFAR